MANSVIEDWENPAGILWRDLNSSKPRRDNTEAIYQLPLSMRGGRRSGVRDYVVETANVTYEDGSKMYPLDIRTGCLATLSVLSQIWSMERRTPVGMIPNQRRSRPEVLRLSFMPFRPNSFSKRKLPQGCKSVLNQVLLRTQQISLCSRLILITFAMSNFTNLTTTACSSFFTPSRPSYSFHISPS
jgi:hypothetical protein